MTGRQKLKVLIVEDSEDDTLLLLRELRRGGYEPAFERVETEKDMRAALKRQAWDIIISDYKMPRFSGLAALEIYRETGLDIPFILVSGTIGEEIATEAMVLGAHDYVMKDNPVRLVPAVQRELREAQARRERKKADEKLKNTLDFQQQLVNTLPLPVFYKDVEGRYQGCNEAFERFFGKKRQEIIGRTVYDTSPKSIADVYHEKDMALLNNPGTQIYESVVRDTGGAIHNVIFHKATFRAADGSVDGLIGIIVDITENKKLEESLRKSEEDYRNIYDNAMVGLFQSTPGGAYLRVNPALATIHGFASPDEMKGAITNIGEQLYVNPEDRKKFMELLDESDRISGFEAQLYRKDRSKVWISMNVRVVRDEDGILAFYEGIVEDITSRKLAEEELKTSTNKLRKNLIGTIQVVSMMLETRDPYTGGHQKRVSRLARAISQEMGLSKDRIDSIRMAGNIHDIGKMSVPAEILSKPTRLSDIEMSLLKVHPQTGYDILRVVELPPPIAEIVLQHHERLDGSGYPQGLKNGEILLEAQILSVADVVEAMSSHRPYRPALGLDAALEEIEKNKGTLYHPEVVEICVRLFREKGFEFGE